MKLSLKTVTYLGLCLTFLPLLSREAAAVSYSNDNLDAMLCFRKLNAPNPFDLEVDIGPISNLSALSAGTVINLSQVYYTTNQLLDAMGVSTFDNVSFSVTAGAYDVGFQNSFPYPFHTTWLTYGRTNATSQTTPFARGTSTALGLADTYIAQIGGNASAYSGSNPTGANNTATAVEIPPASTGGSCEVPLGPGGNLKGQSPVPVENRAPSPFTNAIVSDLYIDVPTTQADPFNTNATSGKVSYLGYFTFSPDGSVTFTRQVHSAPPAPTLTIANPSLNTYAISFTSANSATYSLFYTNVAGITAPVSTWSTVSTNVTGNGASVTFIDVTTDSNRVYRVQGH